MLTNLQKEMLRGHPHLERPLLRTTDGESWGDALQPGFGSSVGGTHPINRPRLRGNDADLRRNPLSCSSLPVTALGQLGPTHQSHARSATSPAPPAPLPSLGRGVGESWDGSAGSSRRQSAPLWLAKWLPAVAVGDGSAAWACGRPGSGQVQAWAWPRGRQPLGNRSDVDRFHIGAVAYPLATGWPVTRLEGNLEYD